MARSYFCCIHGNLRVRYREYGVGEFISSMVDETFNIALWITGLAMTVLTAVVILGGIKSIANVCEKLVPFMAIFYVLGCLILLLMNASQQTKNPIRQALVSSTGTFWDTVVVCAMIGLVLVNSGEWMNGLHGASLTKAAFSDIPFVGPIVLTVGLLTFVFSTILGWSYYGEKAAEYLFGTKVIMPYRWLWVLAVMVGSVLSLPMVWSLADIANGMMAIPNLISLIVLNRVIVAETKQYLWDGNLDEEA